MDFSNANICKADLSKERFIRCYLKGVDFSKSTISGVNLSEADLRGCNFNGTKIKNVSFYKSFLNCASFVEANCYEVDFDCTHLPSVNCSYGTFQNVSFCNASLCGINMYYATLNEVSLKNAAYEISNLLHAINWGLVSDDLCLEMMRRDCLICGTAKMKEWVNKDICPFNRTVKRDFIFEENKSLWKPGKPKLNDKNLFIALCEEKKIAINI